MQASPVQGFLQWKQPVSDMGTAGSEGLALSNTAWVEFISVRGMKIYLHSVILSSEASLLIL